MDSLGSMFGSGGADAASSAAMAGGGAADAPAAAGMGGDVSGGASGAGMPSGAGGGGWNSFLTGYAGGKPADPSNIPGSYWAGVLAKSIQQGQQQKSNPGYPPMMQPQQPMAPFSGGAGGGVNPMGMDPSSAMLLQQLIAGTNARRAAGTGTQPMMAFGGQPNAFGQVF